MMLFLDSVFGFKSPLIYFAHNSGRNVYLFPGLNSF